MKTALRTLAMIGLVGLAGCVTVRRAPETLGVGGSGMDVGSAEEACRQSARERGWRDLNWLEEVRYTGPTTARLRFDRLGWFTADATCFYDFSTGAASVR
jgi:hypothetical protein